jgi:predicted transcriptional regulator
MAKKARTQDEKLILSLYDFAAKSGDLFAPFNKYDVGKLAGLQPKGVDTILKLLVQANFVKKSGESDIYLTQNGERLALQLLDES